MRSDVFPWPDPSRKTDWSHGLFSGVFRRALTGQATSQAFGQLIGAT